MMSVTEASPLLKREKNDTENKTTTSQTSSVAIHVLAELIGARHLLITEKRVEPYCVVQFGSRTLHRTKPLMKSTKSSTSTHDPIWSIKESPLFIVSILPNDLSNKKNLVVTLWGRRPARKLKVKKPQVDFCGKISIKASSVLESCTEKRVELNLVDDLGRNIAGASDKTPMLALRFRVASEADLRFVHAWNQATESQSTMIPRTVLNGTGILPQEHRQRANLVTELEEGKVPGAKLRTAISSSVSSAVPRSSLRNNEVRVKPCPDPDKQIRTMFMARTDLKAATKLPSRQWIEAGSGTLGRLYLEVLSCHDLPNVDIGNAVGNQTDAFVSVVYGDALAETSVIDDELSPHWPPWTQRAFVFQMMHPSQVLYLAVFGYKRGLLNHVPIGRVEINPVNLQRDTEYNLQYSLSQSSHVTDRKARGTIRVRLRMEVNNERVSLMAALRPYPAVYVNVRKRKSLRVARYTCMGEYDNEEKFSLRVLLAYVDELKDNYLRRILYSINDGGQSLIFWRGQVKVGPVWLPLHSFLLFCVSILLVERPHMIPGLFCLGVAWFMLVNMHVRIQSPSPWHRCSSFGHYLRILLLGSSLQAFDRVDPADGWEEQKEIEDALKKRVDEDARFFEKKEAAEKELEEVENIVLQTKSNAAIIPVELLVILGKVQGIVGDICRLCRFIDALIIWEESDLSFWITAFFLAIGVIFLFVPWGFLLKWILRITVVLLMGPQNKLVDLYLKRISSDERKLRQLFAVRWFLARCRQEEAGKLKAFLHVLYGKYSTAVPTIMWTPHQDRPLPESEARVMDTSDIQEGPQVDLPYIPGQTLYGLMIPRPYDEWLLNREESNQGKLRVKAALATLSTSPSAPTPTPTFDGNDNVEDEGVEVTDEYDEEAGFVEHLLLGTPVAQSGSMKREESLRGDWGVEIADTFDDEARFVQQSWRGSVHDFPDVDLSDDDENNIDGGNPHEEGRSMKREESLRGDWGVEVVDAFDNEARFVQRSWRGSVHDFPDLSGENSKDGETPHKEATRDLSRTSTPNEAPSDEELVELCTPAQGQLPEEIIGLEELSVATETVEELAVLGSRTEGVAAETIEELAVQHALGSQTEGVEAETFEEAAAESQREVEVPKEKRVWEWRQKPLFRKYMQEKKEPNRTPQARAESSEELGVEVMDLFDDEAAFVQTYHSEDHD
jgi:hypothetical protein